MENWVENNWIRITVALNVDYFLEIVIRISIRLLGLTFHQFLCVVSCWVTLEVLFNHCSIRWKPSSFTHSLQIYYIGLIRIIPQLFWAWVTNRDPKLIFTMSKLFVLYVVNNYFVRITWKEVSKSTTKIQY